MTDHDPETGEIPQSERLISEEFRIVAKRWVELNKAASLLEETKSAVKSQMIINNPGISVARAEHEALASLEWKEHIEKMVEARAAANLARVQMKYIELKFSEWMSSDANQRKERVYSR